jgi:hypothetical protein
MDRLIERQTFYPDADIYEDWEKDDQLTREARRVCHTKADWMYFVRTWNAAAKKAGENVRIRSVEIGEW